MTKCFVIMPAMAVKPHRPTKLELTILRSLWDGDPGSVRDIQARLSDTKETGYTTVLKMLQIRPAAEVCCGFGRTESRM